MISREVIQKILEAGVQAPSGSNSQPWRFDVTGSAIDVYMLPEKDHPILNFRNRGTLLAHGALIENIVIAAGHYVVGTAIDLFPDKNDPNLVARIALKENEGVERLDLFGAIFERATNRKPYTTKKINEDVQATFIGIPAEIGEYDIVLKVTAERGQIVTLARAASVNERVMFENEPLHKLLFEEIVWTETEEKEKKSGLYFKTMELAPLQAFALKLFKHWPIMNFLNHFGVARAIAKGNAKGYAACGLYGAVLCGTEDSDFVRAGMVVERAWLQAAALGLSFHLQTGVNFLWQGIAAGTQTIFSEQHVQIVRDGYKIMTDIFNAEGKCIPAIFRIGYDGQPSGRSSRKAPEILFR